MRGLARFEWDWSDACHHEAVDASGFQTERRVGIGATGNRHGLTGRASRVGNIRCSGSRVRGANGRKSEVGSTSR